jgi:putative flippase GtrA
VRVFAWLARVLTGACVTDTSSGLRVMRAELLRTVRQTQPQYQTSELLVGAVLAGYRVAEVPTVMRPRLSGESKKGDNLSYALRYCRVLLATWWRESRRRDGVRQSTPPLPVRLVRYALGSVICLAVSEAVLFVLVLAGMAGWRASVLASVAGIVPGYPLNRTWTFGRRGRSSWREVVPYWSSAVAGTVFAAVVVGLATPWARRVTRDSLAAAIIDLAMYVGAYGLIWLVKFAYLDRMLFRSPARTPAPASGPGASVVPLSGQHRARRLDARPENTLLLDLTGDDADLAHSRPHEGAADA